MPSARTTIFGSALKSRFGVNGIQYSSSETGFACERVLDLRFGVAHRGLLVLRNAKQILNPTLVYSCDLVQRFPVVVN